jgi:glycosyltransferase involved in cell wall biosynthesis
MNFDSDWSLKDATPGGDQRITAACVLDDFSFLSLEPELELIPLYPDSWTEAFRTKVDLFLVEAFWRGSGGAWKGIAYDYNVRERELIRNIARWCRRNHIPTVFWNKEDPPHFPEFLDIALEFDHIFTTDANCLSKYQEHGRNAKVMPFAAQPLLFNPVEIYPERKDRVCFAGSYMPLYPERRRDFDTLAPRLMEVGLDIYDRNLDRGDPRYRFPEHYDHLIRGTLKGEQILEAYKGYLFGLNMNSIKDSPTMFARRVYELMACNTIVISNNSTGIHAIFEDMVICSDDPDHILERLTTLRSHPEQYRKLRLRALREVMNRHTYRDRMDLIRIDVLGIVPETKLKGILCLASSKAPEKMEGLARCLREQTVSGGELLQTDLDDLDRFREAWQEARSSDRLLALMDPEDHYGPHYLEDIALAFYYSGAMAVTKWCHLNGKGGLVNQGSQYRWVQSTHPEALVIDPERVSFEEMLTLRTGTVAPGVKCLSLDEFNYVHTPDPGIDLSMVDL